MFCKMEGYKSMMAGKCISGGLLLSLLCITITGCSQTALSAKENGEEWVIQRKEKVEEHLSLELDEDFSDLEGGRVLHALPEVKPYKQDEEKFRKKYFSDVQDVEYSETKRNEVVSSSVCYVEKGSSYHSLTLSEENYDLYSEKADLIMYMVQSGNAVSFLRRDMSEQYPEQELSFMTSKEALELGNEIMEEAGYPYDPAYTECYALDRESLNKVLEEAKLEDGLFSLSEAGGYEWEEKEFQDSDETYFLFYPLMADHIPISSNTEFAFILPYSYVLVDHTGVYSFLVGENIRVTGQEEEDIISPDKALSTVTHLFQNMILTQDFIIQDMDLEYQLTFQDSDTREMTLSPVWTFSVRIMDEDGTGSTVEQMNIDALTGKRLLAG